jgi:hypothetical protein
MALACTHLHIRSPMSELPLHIILTA